MQPLIKLNQEGESDDDTTEIDQSTSLCIVKNEELECNLSDDDDTNNVMEAEDDKEYHKSQIEIPSRPDFAAMAREKFPNIDQQMDQLMKDIISNPSCEAERRIKAMTESQLSYLKAIKYIQRCGSF